MDILTKPPDVAAALTGKPSPLTHAFETVCVYEAGEWDAVPKDIPGLPEMYAKSLQSCREVFQSV